MFGGLELLPIRETLRGGVTSLERVERTLSRLEAGLASLSSLE